MIMLINGNRWRWWFWCWCIIERLWYIDDNELSLKTDKLTNKLTETNDIVKWYMRWIGKYGKLLTPKEEGDLAIKVEEAENANNYYKFKRARDMLVKRNLIMLKDIKIEV